MNTQSNSFERLLWSGSHKQKLSMLNALLLDSSVNGINTEDREAIGILHYRHRKCGSLDY